MDSPFNIPWNLTTTVALLAPVIFFFLIKKLKKSNISFSVKLPPGPNTLPIIGNLHLISALPFRSFRDLAEKYGPIMLLKLGEVPAVVVSSPEIAKQVLKDYDPKFADRPGAIALNIMWYNYIDIAFCPYGEYWRQMRKICIVELLSGKTVRSFVSIRKDEVARLIKYIHLSSGKPVNLTEKIFSTNSSITCRAAFGKVCKDSNALITVMREALEMGSGFLIADLFPTSKIISSLSWPTKLKLLRMRRKLDWILDDIINEHKENLANMEAENGKDSGRRSGNGELGNEDLIDVLLRIKESGELQFPINNDNIKAVLHDIFAAGTETSSTTIDWAMAELMRNPRVMAKAQAEVRQAFKGSNTNTEEHDLQKLKYLKLVIKETLRLHPPGPMLPRASREECQISGYTIPAKLKVLVNIWAIQRDPKYWTNPESFEPERFENQSVDFTGADFEYLPFGSGKRMCPGMTFGLASIELLLAQLLYNFNWKLPDGVKAEDLDTIEDLGLAAARKENLFVVATSYEPL